MRGAAVVVIDTDDDGDQKLRHELVRRDQRFVVDGKTLTTDQLIGETEFATFPAELRRYDERKIGKAIAESAVLLGAITLGFGVVCGIECRDGSRVKTAAEVAAISVGALAVLGLATMLVINECAAVRPLARHGDEEAAGRDLARICRDVGER